MLCTWFRLPSTLLYVLYSCDIGRGVISKNPSICDGISKHRHLWAGGICSIEHHRFKSSCGSIYTAPLPTYLREYLTPSFYLLSKRQIKRERVLHNHLFRDLVVQHRIRWCRDVRTILPTLTKDNIIIPLIFVPAGENGTTGRVYLYNRPHISLFRKLNEIIIWQ